MQSIGRNSIYHTYFKKNTERPNPLSNKYMLKDMVIYFKINMHIN